MASDREDDVLVDSTSTIADFFMTASVIVTTRLFTWNNLTQTEQRVIDVILETNPCSTGIISAIKALCELVNDRFDIQGYLSFTASKQIVEDRKQYIGWVKLGKEKGWLK